MGIRLFDDIFVLLMVAVGTEIMVFGVVFDALDALGLGGVEEDVA